ncbi:hypothetical protein TYRP_016340 [Tyrophagus putrescentiae]|nr:hypothetical protein TYRP_016340 [Tyrophagus putrescentiae]
MQRRATARTNFMFGGGGGLVSNVNVMQLMFFVRVSQLSFQVSDQLFQLSTLMFNGRQQVTMVSLVLGNDLFDVGQQGRGPSFQRFNEAFVGMRSRKNSCLKAVVTSAVVSLLDQSGEGLLVAGQLLFVASGLTTMRVLGQHLLGLLHQSLTLGNKTVVVVALMMVVLGFSNKKQLLRDAVLK